MKLRLPAFFVAVASATLAGCATYSTDRADRPECCAKAEATTAFSDKSLYQLDSLWTTDENRQIKLSELSGRPQIVAMFFANCQIACPIIVNDMKRIEAALPADVRARVGVGSVKIRCCGANPSFQVAPAFAGEVQARLLGDELAELGKQLIGKAVGHA